MKRPASVVLLVGSPKKGTSTSEVLGTYVLDRLGGYGIAGPVVRLHRALETTAAWNGLQVMVDVAQLVILATPLYVDSLPSHVTAALERMTAHREGHQAGPDQRLACIMNCGFPEARHNETALRICRQFAREAGFEWAGGLALGGGDAIEGRPLGKMSGMVRHVVAALDLAADALAEGSDIPDRAVALMARPLVPPALFVIGGSVHWRRRARRFGAQWRMHAQPYKEGSGLKA